jgi:RNA polymerase sigma-70 factor, ECF subfamily
VQAQAPQEVTQLLQAWCRGNKAALGQLIPLVHEELHRLAHRYMRRERSGHMLQTSALLNEAYLRLIDVNQVEWRNRAHFFAISANLMRRILVDFARSRGYRKRSGHVRKVILDEACIASPQQGADLVALDDALNAMAGFDPRQAQVVELLFFAGLSEKEAAEGLGVSSRTVKRDWASAKAWLAREMTRGEEP